VFRNGLFVLTGDASGSLKTWDVRTGKCIQSIMNESTKKPISHITTCNKTRNTLVGGAVDVEEEEPRFMAVNSYDNGRRSSLDQKKKENGGCGFDLDCCSYARVRSRILAA
jgi:hypothetical protein